MDYKGIWGVINAYGHFVQKCWKKVFDTLKSDWNDNCIIFYINVNFYILNEVNNNGSIGFKMFVHFSFIFFRNNFLDWGLHPIFTLSSLIIQKLISKIL